MPILHAIIALMRLFHRAILASLLMAMQGLSAGDGPRAGAVSRSWELDFTFHDPQRIVVKAAGDENVTVYWYVLYEVTNRTGQDVDFYPSFRLVTDTLKVVEGGLDVSPRVYDAIQSRHEGAYPFFAPPWKITGPLLQGEENARASAVVFHTFDREASGFTVYVSGLSGDVERVNNPAARIGETVSADGNPYFLLRRTLAIRYDLPGDPSTRALAEPIRRSREWVMR
jgi:hypothetical protein